MSRRFLPLLPGLALAIACVGSSAAAQPEEVVPACIPAGGGRLAMDIRGAFEAAVDWGNEGTRCEGGPRPRGDALRLMFSREDEALLVVVAITGLEREVVGKGMPANLTVVRQGLGEFYGTLGADACLVDVEENRPEEGIRHAYRISGRGRCLAPIDAIGRQGELRVERFEFTGIAYWPEDEHDES
jgi:hypothetical protein